MQIQVMAQIQIQITRHGSKFEIASSSLKGEDHITNIQLKYKRKKNALET